MEEAKKPMLLEVVRQRIRLKHYSHRTEKSYIHWIRHFVRFHNRQHPGNLGKPDIEAFLTYLAVDRKVSASTQNMAINALLFLYREVLEYLHKLCFRFNQCFWIAEIPNRLISLCLDHRPFSLR